MAIQVDIFTVLVLSVCIVFAQERSEGPFIVSPKDVTTGLNSGATFLCRFRGLAATAIINGDGIGNRTDVEQIGQYDFEPIPGTYDLAIRVIASEANNNSEIWCRGHEPDVNSSRARLMVQGFLAAPSNVDTEAINATAISVTWLAPFTLNITYEDPDISNYTVYINNTATGQNEPRTVISTGFNFSGFSEEDPSPCHDYSFSVSASNVVGEGERSEEVFQHFEGECQESTETTPPTHAPSRNRFLPLLALVGLIVFICIVVFLCWKKFRSSKQDDDSSQGSGQPVSLRTVNVEDGPENVRVLPHQENGTGAAAGGPPPPPIPGLGMQRKGASGPGTVRRRRAKDYLQSEPKLSDFMNQVAARTNKWRKLGLELGLTRTALDKIADSATAPDERFRAVFEEWREKETEHFNWAEIVQALKSQNVGEVKLAESLKNLLMYHPD